MAPREASKTSAPAAALCSRTVPSRKPVLQAARLAAVELFPTASGSGVPAAPPWEFHPPGILSAHSVARTLDSSLALVTLIEAALAKPERQIVGHRLERISVWRLLPSWFSAARGHLPHRCGRIATGSDGRAKTINWVSGTFSARLASMTLTRRRLFKNLRNHHQGSIRLTRPTRFAQITAEFC